MVHGVTARGWVCRNDAEVTRARRTASTCINSTSTRPPPVNEYDLLNQGDVNKLVNRYNILEDTDGGCNNGECTEADNSRFMQHVYDNEFCSGNIDANGKEVKKKFYRAVGFGPCQPYWYDNRDLGDNTKALYAGEVDNHGRALDPPYVVSSACDLEGYDCLTGETTDGSDENCFGFNSEGVLRRLMTHKALEYSIKSDVSSDEKERIQSVESPLMIPDICCDNIENSRGTAFIGCDANGNNSYFIDDILTLTNENLNQCGTLKGPACLPAKGTDMGNKNMMDMCNRKTEGRSKNDLPDYNELPENYNMYEYNRRFKEFCRSKQPEESGTHDPTKPDINGECSFFQPLPFPNFPHKKPAPNVNDWDHGNSKEGKFRFTLPEPIDGINYNSCLGGHNIDTSLNIVDIEFKDKQFDWYIPEDEITKTYSEVHSAEIADCNKCNDPPECTNESTQKLRFILDKSKNNKERRKGLALSAAEEETEYTVPEELDENNPYIKVHCKVGTKVKFGPREGPVIYSHRSGFSPHVSMRSDDLRNNRLGEQINVGNEVTNAYYFPVQCCPTDEGMEAMCNGYCNKPREVPAGCTGTAREPGETCDLDASTDGSAECPTGCVHTPPTTLTPTPSTPARAGLGDDAYSYTDIAVIAAVICGLLLVIKYTGVGEFLLEKLGLF